MRKIHTISSLFISLALVVSPLSIVGSVNVLADDDQGLSNIGGRSKVIILAWIQFKRSF